LGRHVHVLPDFHGNRSPIGDPNLRGAVIGLDLDASKYSLAILYLAAMQGIAVQTHHIIAKCNESGHQLEGISMSGGLVHNHLFVQILADAAGLPVYLPKELNSTVALGAAILGGVAYFQPCDIMVLFFTDTFPIT
jgi:ribulose kinase